MKKQAKLGAMGLSLAMAAIMSDNYQITEEPLRTGRPEPPPRKFKTPPFKEQDGVVKTIIEYKLVQSGQSKQGPRKQARTLIKIKDWIDKGFLTQEDIE